MKNGKEMMRALCLPYKRMEDEQMLAELKQANSYTTTENGAITYQSTMSDCLDLFATIGALRHEDETEITARFIRAYAENADVAMKILFFARDIHEGLGERRVFRIILRKLAWMHPDSVKKNMPLIAEYGRFDDLLSCLDTPCEESALTYLFEQFQADQKRLANGEAISLLAKWLPSINASNAQTIKRAKKIARFFQLSDKEYRQNLSAMRKSLHLIENHLREQDYTFDYAKQPSRALFKYRKAFLHNDELRYQAYLDQVKTGQKKMNTSQVMPYEVVQQGLDLLGPRYYYGVGAPECSIDVAQKELLNTIWEQLPNYETTEDTLAVIDTSGSMYFNYKKPIPASVALSLGLYFAQHNQGAFRNHFIEFSRKPQLIEIKGKTFMDQLEYLATFNEVANTNLEGVFDLILQTALEYELPQTALPAKLLIISDMEFDACVDNHEVTNFEQAKQKFASFGYTLPKIVFWNVASRNNQQPVTQNEAGVYLVSGVTPKIFELVVSEALNPYQFMLEVVESPRYQQITA